MCIPYIYHLITLLTLSSAFDPQPEDPCVKAMYKQFKQVQLSTPLSDLARMFDRDYYALVVAQQVLY